MSVFHIDRLSNTGFDVEIGSKTYRIKQFSLRDQGNLQAIIRKVQPHPVTETIELVKGMPSGVAAEMLKDARKAAQLWPQAVTTQDGLQILVNSGEGQKAVLRFAMGLSDSEAEELMGDLSFQDFMRIAAIAISGEDPTGDDDPKAETEVAQATG